MKQDNKNTLDNRKNEQLDTFRENSDDERLTTDQGLRVDHTDDSLKAGERGPTIMEDFHFREKLTHFDHERIPERVVHARGSAAHGFFQLYEPIPELTKAKFLNDPSVQTPVFVRFSTVVGFRGSADTVRDVRGFATKFYTEEGNYDLVGNNMPVFFIQDAVKFPDLVHAIKPEPHNEMPQASAAHDNFWDFISLMPESMHMIMWVLSDRALPRSYRMMEGFGVHTFRMVNAEGKGRFVKFHWKPALGTHSLVWDETQKIAGKDPDFNRRDLWEAIESGHYPEFELGVQVVEEEDEHKFEFDLLDPTKIIPEEMVPVKIVGKMTLNRNPDNFFAETEQVAFHPGNVVPGIDFTNDPLLQGRLFSYLDTQLIRLGGPNFAEIPINRPVAPVHNNQRDGYSRQTINVGKVNYSPNSLRGGCPMTSSWAEGGFVHYQEKVEGQKIKNRSDKFREFYNQATLFWNSLTDPEKDRLVEAAHFELGKVEVMEVRERMVEQFNNVDHTLARRIAAGVGVTPPASPVRDNHGQSSSAISTEDTVKDTVTSRKVAVLAMDGYNAKQLMAFKNALKEKGAMAVLISKNGGKLKSEDGEEMKVDKTFITTTSVVFDAVYVPGGQQSVGQLIEMGDARHFVNEAFMHGKPILASGHGVEFLASAQLEDITLASETEDLKDDQGVVTARKTEDLSGFIDKSLSAIAQHRYWNRGGTDKVAA